MPWRSFSLAMRTHRVRPSEKTSLGAIPWFAPVRLSSHRLTTSRRGGLRTPVTTAQRQRCLPLATGSSSTHVVEMKCLGVRTALQHGRGDRAPPRKALSTLSPGLSPLGHLTWERPPRGGVGPHARKEGMRSGSRAGRIEWLGPRKNLHFAHAPHLHPKTTDLWSSHGAQFSYPVWEGLRPCSERLL